MSRPRNSIRLSPRLRAVADFVREGAVVADIGTDHGLLALDLLERGRVVLCIASEPSSGQLAKAEARAEKSPAWSRLSLRVGRGLEVLSPRDHVSVIVIAGLGGRAICRILDHPRRQEIAPRNLILQPQTEPAVVRSWLAATGYRLARERLVSSGERRYVVLDAEPGRQDLRHPALSPEDLLEAGPVLVRSGDPAVEAYWRRERERSVALLEIARGGRGLSDAKMRAALADRVLAALGPPKHVRP